MEIRVAQPFLLPGVLQSADYAREVVRMGRPLDTSAEVDAAVERRVRRAAHLLREGGPRITVLVPEHVIRAARGIHPDALSHVLALAESACVQLIPDGVHLAAATGAFRLIGFDDSRLPVLFAESAVGGSLVDHPALVARFVAAMNTLQGWAMSPDESRKRIEEANDDDRVE